MLSRTPTLEQLRESEVYDPQVGYSQQQLEEFENTFNWILDQWQLGLPEDTTLEEYNEQSALKVTQEDYNYIFGDLNLIQENLNDVVSKLPAVEEGAPPRVSPRVSPRVGSGRVSPVTATGRSRSLSAGRRAALETQPVARSPSRSASPPRRTTGRREAREARAGEGEARKKKKVRGKSPVPTVINTGHGQAEQLTDKGITEVNYWHFKVPGSTWEADILVNKGVSIVGMTQEQIHNEAIRGMTRKEIEKAKRESVVNDLVRYKNNFTVGKVNKLPWAIHTNGKTILELHEAIVTLNGAMAIYGNAKFRVTSSGGRSVIVDPEKDIEYLGRVLAQRVRIYDYYVRALRTRRPIVAAPMTAFKGQNTRIRLTPEAVQWVNQEDFTVAAEYGPIYSNERYNNLWDYIEAVTGKTKGDTFLSRGFVTKGNYQSLLRLVPKKIPAPAAPKEEKRKRGEKKVKKAPQPRRKPKYEYTQAMLDSFGAIKATFDVKSKVDSTKIDNTSDKTVLQILSERLGADIFSQDVLINTGIMPLFVATYYPNETAALANPEFFGNYADSSAKNKASLDQFIAESTAIRQFLDAVSESRAIRQEEVKEQEKEEKKAAALEERREAARARTGTRVRTGARRQ